MNNVYTMVSTTNDRFKYLEGTSGVLQYDDFYNVYWFNNFHTSAIVSKLDEDGLLTLRTLNSVYEFKKENKDDK